MVELLLPIVLASCTDIANTAVPVAQLRYQHHVNVANAE
jgi:hypothetical protein